MPPSAWILDECLELIHVVSLWKSTRCMRVRLSFTIWQRSCPRNSLRAIGSTYCWWLMHQYTYFDWTMSRDVVFRLVARGRESRGPFCQLGLGDTRFGPCCVWAQLLGQGNVRCGWFWLDPCDVLANCWGR